MLTGLDGISLATVIPMVTAVDSYVIGTVRRETAERRAERATGMDKDEWRKAYWPYLEQTFATGRFPALERMVRDGSRLDADQTFRTGLAFLLDGIAAHL
ncbi:hypothetical protein GCM10029964_065360 [Kibdelosporangium lantanae]